MTVTHKGDAHRLRFYWVCHSVIVCHGAFSHTYARAGADDCYYLYIVPVANVYINTMTHHDTMTIVVISRAVAVIVLCHSKNNGDNSNNNNFFVLAGFCNGF